MALTEQQEDLICTFLGFAGSASYDTARRYLEAGGWDLEVAVPDFFQTSGNDHAAPDIVADEEINAEDVDEDFETMNYRYEDETDEEAFDESDDGDEDYSMTEFAEEEEEETRVISETDTRSFPSLYELMFRGNFQMAKQEARRMNKWLLVNLQDSSSVNLSWNEEIASVLKQNFVFSRYVIDSADGKSVRKFYNLDCFSVVMVVEPITGRKIHTFPGMALRETLLETLLSYSGSNPVDYCMSSYKQKEQPIEELLEDLKLQEEVVNDDPVEEDDVVDQDPGFPPLPEEPSEDDRKVVCKVGVRLPGGRRIQRKFLLSDSIQVLWSFCCSEMEEVDQKRPFSVGFGTPGRFECLDYGSGATLGESGVGNCMLSIR